MSGLIKSGRRTTLPPRRRLRRILPVLRRVSTVAVVDKQSRDRLALTIRAQAQACGRLGSPLYADLLSRVAEDVLADGVSARILAGHHDDQGWSALALRLAGAVHRLVLDGRAPALARFYPSAGGSPDPSPGAVWGAFRRVLEAHGEELRALLDQPPQTNEVGRSAALLGGLLRLADTYGHPVRLIEIGASGGLNLRADHFRYESEGHVVWGPPDSPVILNDAWRGPLPPLGAPLSVVERVGYDVAPVDATTPEGQLTLLSYVWPDQVSRLMRLRASFEVARRVPVSLWQASAAEAVARLTLRSGHTTVLWHSVMWQYLSPEEQAEVTARLAMLGREASGDAPLAHLSLEPGRRDPFAAPEFLVTLRTWPDGDDLVIAEASPHGLPTTWDAR